jgi:signal transduction histidine kinase/FixJ family two-component response regulator
LQEALECAGNGGTWHGEVHVRDAAGSEVPTILNVAPVDVEGTAVRHVALLFVDITAQKQLEAELREASVEARQAVKAKSAFLANMSHEIRTPLNGIIGFADLLLADDPRDDQKEALAHLHAAGRSLMTVLDDVLDISKLEAGRYDLHPASFDVEELLEGIEALYYRDAKAKGLALTFTRDPALPRCLYADPDRIRQILGNLVSNAIKYTETGSVTVSVALADEAPPDGDESSLRLRFDVRDTGIGIAAQNQNRVFDIFEQLNQSRRRRIAGTGLGLAICKRLVESMDGRIWVESEPGVGSVFSCAISVGIGFDDASLVAGESVLSADAEGSRTLHILIADDDRVSAIVATRLLESGGHTVDTATTGVEAVRAVRTRSFDLVFMDVQMPEMDGLTATAEIRRSVGSRLPIVGLSASAVGEERAAMLAAGMDAVLAKPVTKETLLATANRATENRPTADHSAADQSARSRPARDQSAAQER